MANSEIDIAACWLGLLGHHVAVADLSGSYQVCQSWDVWVDQKNAEGE